MEKSKQKRITNAELDAALAEIRREQKAEQKAWFAAQKIKAAAKAKMEVFQKAATLALVYQIGIDCESQRLARLAQSSSVVNGMRLKRDVENFPDR